MNGKSYALVTGASQGLGKAFAIELAQKGIHLILVSLPGQGLVTLCQELAAEYGVDCRAYETDLTELENVKQLTDWVNQHFNLFVLVNNAGIGGTKRMLDADVQYINRIVQLNVVATSVLTHQLLPNLVRQPQAYILNVSSMAAFSPIGFKTVYPASKAFIHSFSRGLYQELKGTNVFVSVVNPGAMRTNAETSGRIARQGLLGRLTLLEPQKVAKFCVDRLFKRDTVIVVNPVSWLLVHLLPIWIKLPLLTRTIQRELVLETA